MGLDAFKTDVEENSKNRRKRKSKTSNSYLNETEEHTDTKNKVKSILEANGFEVRLEHTIKLNKTKQLRPDVYAKQNDECQDIIDGLEQGDVLAIEVGDVNAHRVKLLSLGFDYVALIPKGDSFKDRVEVKLHDGSNSDKQKEIKEMTQHSRAERKRGPYMDADAYGRLSDAADRYDMTIQDMLDELITSTINEDGKVKEPHSLSVLRNDLKQ